VSIEVERLRSCDARTAMVCLRILHRSVLEPIAKPFHLEASELHKVLWNLKHEFYENDVSFFIT